MTGRWQSAQKEQLHLRERCQALNPRLVLQRGYALVRQNNGEIVRDSDRLEIGTVYRFFPNKPSVAFM